MWPRSVAKIYARRPDDHTRRKLQAMVELGTEELTSFAAWPQGLVLDSRTGAAVGFLMPRVDAHREIHALYGPTARKAAFPDASWAFLVRVARNLAAAFDAVHRHGHVIGDVNQGNVVVSRKATVRLIDCDSFQVTHLGETYPCRVGVPLFTPPELQGQRLDSVQRTQDHDRFGLAVLVFHLLFMGRHPFTGRHRDRAVPVEAAIREGLFAFGQEARAQGWAPPPFSLVLEDVTRPVAELFERAFGRKAAAGAPRPSADEWARELDALEARLVLCGDDPRHVHARAKAPARGAASRKPAGRPSTSWPRARPPTPSTWRRRGGRSRRSCLRERPRCPIPRPSRLDARRARAPPAASGAPSRAPCPRGAPLGSARKRSARRGRSRRRRRPCVASRTSGRPFAGTAASWPARRSSRRRRPPSTA